MIRIVCIAAWIWVDVFEDGAVRHIQKINIWKEDDTYYLCFRNSIGYTSVYTFVLLQGFKKVALHLKL